MKICWIGLGNMGLPMAGHLHVAGYELTGFDLSPEARTAAAAAGIRIGDCAEEAAAGADVVVTMLPEGEHVRTALLDSGALTKSAPGSLVLDCSTISATDARDIAGAVTTTGRRFLDAPVSGGTSGAHQATLTFMVGGAAADLDGARPVLEVLGARIFHAGDTGAGQSAKMVNNMMLAMNMQSVSEAAVLAQRLGITPETVIDIVGKSTGDSWALRNYYPVAGAVEVAPSSRDFTGGFATKLMRKDLGLVLATTAEHGLDTTATAEVARRLDHLIDEGHGELDFSVLVRLVDSTLEATTAVDELGAAR